MDWLWVPLHSDDLLRLVTKDNSCCRNRQNTLAFTYILVSGVKGATGSSLSQTSCWEMPLTALTSASRIEGPMSPSIPQPWTTTQTHRCSLGTHPRILPKQFANIKPFSFIHNYNSRFITPLWLFKLEISTGTQTSSGSCLAKTRWRRPPNRTHTSTTW